MKKRTYIYGIIILLIAVSVLGCQGNNALLNDSDAVMPEADQSSTHIEGIRYTQKGAEALIYTKEEWMLVNADIGDNHIQLLEPVSNPSMQMLHTHPISGYFVGSIQSGILENGKATLYFVDKETDKHLDLLEIDLASNEILWDAHVDPLFSRVSYQIFSSRGLKTYVHFLATNITQEVHLDHVRFAIGRDGRLGEITAHANEKDHILTWLTDHSLVVEADPQLYDLVISNGIVMDPDSNTMKFAYNIGIIGDKIVTITPASLDGKDNIDATGLIVSPGFIDMLAFNLNDTAAKYKITDGVTTSLSMHGCTEDFNAFFRSYASRPPYVNYGGAIFAIRLRFEQGLSGGSVPNASQIERMANRVRQEILAGGLALAFSPEYYPGTTSEEIVALMAVAAEYDIPTHFHGRYSAISGEESGIVGVHEILDYGRKTGGRVHFMHLHSTGGTGMMDEALEAINQAREEGVRVTYDIYPYDSWISRINWERYRPGWQERYGITYSDLQMAGTSERLTQETFNYYRSVGGLCIAYAMNEDEIIQALSKDDAMVGSDECVVAEVADDSHPRGSGTFSKILGRYVRDEDYFSLMDGLKKMTINSAKHLEGISEDMALRGRLKEGMIADITVFDYRTIMDQSTVENPATPSIGIHYVIVSGEIGLNEDGLVTSVRAGKPIKSNFK